MKIPKPAVNRGEQLRNIELSRRYSFSENRTSQPVRFVFSKWFTIKPVGSRFTITTDGWIQETEETKKVFSRRKRRHGRWVYTSYILMFAPRRRVDCSKVVINAVGKERKGREILMIVKLIASILTRRRVIVVSLVAISHSNFQDQRPPTRIPRNDSRFLSFSSTFKFWTDPEERIRCTCL